MSDLLPMMQPHPTDPSKGGLLNASAVVEIARRIDTPKSKAFLRAFHAAEADVARETPSLSEADIRDEAVTRAMKAMGHGVVPDDRPN